MNCESYSATNVGKVRKNNEDNFYVNGVYKTSAEMQEYAAADMVTAGVNLYAVCDGMGGEEHGEKASMIAVSALKEFQGKPFINCVREYIDRANKQVCDLIASNGFVRSGTTFAALSIEKGKARAFNIGDSRIYLIRQGKINQLSVDHTRLQQMINMGLATGEDEKNSRDKHVLTQHFGIFPDEMEISPYISGEIEIMENDVFLLCSDGLTDMLSDEEMLKTVTETPDVKNCVCKLIEKALAAGGRDNVTVQIIKCTGKADKKKKSSSNKATIAALLAVALAFAAFFVIKTYIDISNITSSPGEGEVVATPKADEKSTSVSVELPQEIDLQRIKELASVLVTSAYEPESLAVDIENCKTVVHTAFEKTEDGAYLYKDIKLGNSEGIENYKPGDTMKITFTVHFKENSGETPEDYIYIGEYKVK